MKKLCLLIFSLLLMGAMCEPKAPTNPEPKPAPAREIIPPNLEPQPELPPAEPEASLYSVDYKDDNVGLKFNAKAFPQNVKAVEVFLDGQSQGIYTFSDTLYLPRKPGTFKLKLDMLDIVGTSLQETTVDLTID